MIGPMAVVNAYHAEFKKRFPERYSPKRLPSLRQKLHLQTARSFVRWCEENEIDDPLLFIKIYFAYEMEKRGRAPKFEHLEANDLIGLYEEFAPLVEEGRRIKSDPENDPDCRYYRSLMLNAYAHEAVRKDYVLMGQTHLCVAQLGLSGGYHPDSRWCAQCPHVNECAQKLCAREGLDVVALRRNRYDGLPPAVRRYFVSPVKG